MAASRGGTKSTTTQSDNETKRAEIEFYLRASTPTLAATLDAAASSNGFGRNHMTSTETRVGDAATCRAYLQLQVAPYHDRDSFSSNGMQTWIHLKLLSCDKKTIRVVFSLHVGNRWSEKYVTYISVGNHHGTMVDVARGERIECKGKYSYVEPVKENILISDMQLLLEEHLHSDVTLTSGNKNLSAHKAILAARSPVFKAMFSNAYRENETGNVDVDDVDYEVLKEMLHYMYTGKRPEPLADMAERLLPAANKYGLDELKTMCECHLANNLTVSNVVQILILADTHVAEKVKSTAQKFIRQHKARVLLTQEWEDMFYSHTPLAIETVKFMSV